MGKILDALMGRSSKTTRRLSMLISLAISRITVIKNLHTIKCSQAETDVIELLQLGYQDRALIRVEQVIKEQNALDAYVLIENYCRLLVDRTVMVENKRECPDELKEAVLTLTLAASRCGEFPELQEIRYLFTSMFGKEFVKSSTELRNNCQVSPKLIQIFSTQQPSLEIKQNLLKQIAKHNGIILHELGEHEAFDISDNLQRQGAHVHMIVSNEGAALEALKTKGIPTEKHFHEEEGRSSEVSFSKSVISRRVNYRDVEAAAQDAFESASYAAAASRAVVRLSRLESLDDDDIKACNTKA